MGLYTASGVQSNRRLPRFRTLVDSNIMGSFRVLVFLGLIGFTLSGVPERIVDTNTIFFRVYRNDSHKDINIRNVPDDLLPLLDLKNQTTFYIHGFTESVRSLSVRTVVGAYLSKPTGNIVAIDYSAIANPNYIIGVIVVDYVGQAIADALNQLVAKGLNQSNIQIVGHSLGAQVSGHLGEYTNFKIPRIVGLDPAGPLFYSGRYLTKEDAKFVVVIHTDAGVLGETQRVASVDFWPNGGHRTQPGCPIFPRSPDDEDPGGSSQSQLRIQMHSWLSNVTMNTCSIMGHVAMQTLLSWDGKHQLPRVAITILGQMR